jgi:hypothetical protein
LRIVTCIRFGGCAASWKAIAAADAEAEAAAVAVTAEEGDEAEAEVALLAALGGCCAPACCAAVPLLVAPMQTRLPSTLA